MARNVALQVLRGVAAHIPKLNDGEFYFATDTRQLFVGLGGFNYKLSGATFMSVVEINGNVNPNNYIEPNADGTVNIKSPAGQLALDGTDNTGVSQPSGGLGIRGWLSALYSLITNGQSTKQVLATSIDSVQQPKDCGRSKVILSSTRVASITTEALLTLTQKKGDGATTTGTEYTVTAGKTLRIQSIKLYAEFNTAATAAWVSCRLREGAASGGAVSATSDIIAIAESNTVAVTDVIGMGVPPSIITFPDGLEIAGGQQIGISELALNVDLTVTIVLVGYEY